MAGPRNDDLIMKILIFTKNWLGDVLFEVPAMKALRDNFPEAHIVALAPERCLEILNAVPYLNEVRAFDERGSERSPFAKIRFIQWLRSEKFDKVFLFHRSFTRALLAWLGNIPERIGYETPKRKRILTKAVPKPRQAMHQVDYFLVLLKWAGLNVQFGSEYQFFCTESGNKIAQEFLKTGELQEKRFVAFHIGANWGPKRWPATHFAELARRLSRHFFCSIVLTGSRKDIPIAEKIVREATQARVISLCGKTTIEALGAVFQKAAFVVSSDSGPLHIASGVGTSAVALFGPTCPLLTGPRGVGKKIVLQYVPPGYSIPWKGNKLPEGGWMEKITPEEVFKKIIQEKLWEVQKEKIFSSSH